VAFLTGSLCAGEIPLSAAALPLSAIASQPAYSWSAGFIALAWTRRGPSALASSPAAVAPIFFIRSFIAPLAASADPATKPATVTPSETERASVSRAAHEWT